jgi:hypothetical protein
MGLLSKRGGEFVPVAWGQCYKTFWPVIYVFSYKASVLDQVGEV